MMSYEEHDKSGDDKTGREESSESSPPLSDIVNDVFKTVKDEKAGDTGEPGGEELVATSADADEVKAGGDAPQDDTDSETIPDDEEKSPRREEKEKPARITEIAALSEESPKEKGGEPEAAVGSEEESSEGRLHGKGHIPANVSKELFVKSTKSHKSSSTLPTALLCLWIIGMGFLLGWVLRNTREKSADKQAISGGIVKTGGRPAQERSGGWMLETDPPGASVVVNGKLAGTTPLEMPVDSPLLADAPDNVLVILEKEGMLPASFVIDRNSPAKMLTKRLEPLLPGRVEVTSIPPYAEVLIDGQMAGRTPLSLNDVPPGGHELIVRKVNHEEFRQRFTMESEKTVSIKDVKLKDLILEWLEAKVKSDDCNIQYWDDLGHYFYINNRMMDAARSLRRGLQLATMPFAAPKDMPEQQVEIRRNEYNWNRNRIRGNIHKKTRQGSRTYPHLGLDFNLFTRMMNGYKAADQGREQIVREWEKTFKRGRELTFGDKRDLQEAVYLYKDYLRYHPDDPRAMAGMARASLFFGDIAKSRQLIDSALELKPDNLRFRYLMAKCYKDLIDTPALAASGVKYSRRQLWEETLSVLEGYERKEGADSPDLDIQALTKAMEARALAEMHAEEPGGEPENTVKKAKNLAAEALELDVKRKVAEMVKFDVAAAYFALGMKKQASELFQELAGSAGNEDIRSRAAEMLKEM